VEKKDAEKRKIFLRVSTKRRIDQKEHESKPIEHVTRAAKQF
jgi:hypothetical protein